MKDKHTPFSIFCVVLIICLTASYSIVYTAIQLFSPVEPGGNSDALIYISMYKSESVLSHLRYRILTPYLARSIPDPPTYLFNSGRRIDDFWIIKVKFGIINFLFLAATGILLFYFLRRLNFSLSESLLGALFFYTSRPVMQNAGVPMVEASFYFFIILIFYSMITDNFLLLLLGFLAGIFSKEALIILALPTLALTAKEKKLKLLPALLPGIAAYAFLRFYVNPFKGNLYFYLKPATIVWRDFASFLSFSKIADLASSFSLLWLPALYALIKTDLPPLLKRWSLLIPLLLVVILLLYSSLGRSIFYAFPVVIPLALYGIRPTCFPAKD